MNDSNNSVQYIIETPLPNPKISVIIPLYNKAPYIKRSIDSVLSQTVQDFELIIINDGSTDGSDKIVESYNDSRIHLITQENKGVSAARNNGVKAARADLVACLDADDEWLPEFLEQILILRQNFPDAGLYGTGTIIHSYDGPEYFTLHQPELGDRILDSYFWSKNHFVGAIMNSSSCAFDKKILESTGGWCETVQRGEDEDLFARVAYISDVAYLPKPLTRTYKQTLNNSDNIYANLDCPFVEMIYHEYCSNNLKNADSKNIITYADRLRTGIVIRYLHGDKKKAREHIKKIISIKYKIIMTTVYLLVKIHFVRPEFLDKLVAGRRINKTNV